MFDCVMPTRSGRTGQAFTSGGALNLRNARHADDPRPLDPNCGCPACRSYSRAYLHHLIKAGEMLGPMLLTWHNLNYYQDLMAACATPSAKAGSRRMRRSWKRSCCSARPRDDAAGRRPPPRAGRGPRGRRRMSGKSEDRHSAGLTQLGHPVAVPASPEDAVLERVPNPHPGIAYLRALHRARIHRRSARSPASPTSRIS